MRFENFPNRPPGRVHLGKDHVDAMSRQVLGEFLRRVLGIDDLFIRDRYDPYFLCLFQDRNRVGNRRAPLRG